MLEVFFDNEKVFSVFEKILEQSNPIDRKVNMVQILYALGVAPDVGADILRNFVFLDILEETDETAAEGIFKFNPKSPVVFALCSFDEIVGKHAINKLKALTDDGDDTYLDELNNLSDDEFDHSDFEVRIENELSNLFEDL